MATTLACLSKSTHSQEPLRPAKAVWTACKMHQDKNIQKQADIRKWHCDPLTANENESNTALFMKCVTAPHFTL